MYNRRSGHRGIWFPEMRKPRPINHQLPLTPPETATHSHTPTIPRSSRQVRATVRLSADFRRRGRSVGHTLGTIQYIMFTHVHKRLAKPSEAQR